MNMMTSEDGDILALLSETCLTEEQLAASEPEDILPAILEAIKSNDKAVEISPEEAAWADSCFVQTSELSNDDWGPMRNALLDALERPIGSPYDMSEAEHDQGILTKATHSLHAENVSRHDDVNMEQRDNSDDEKDSTQACEVADVIRGAHEHGKQMENYAARTEDGDELASSEALEETNWRDPIFKVWDLEVSSDDDDDDDGELELIKDLKKLLRGKDSTPDAVYPPPGDASTEPLGQINIEELVAGLSDLSIQQTNE